MVRRRTLLGGIFVGYALLEIVVDNVLLFLDLTGDGVPSLTAILLSWIGVDVGVRELALSLERIAPLFGAVGAALIALSLWLVVSS
ncbi:MAG: hypothetical protein ABEJ67_06990 [Halanaeroarchaeum sp.]